MPSSSSIRTFRSFYPPSVVKKSVFENSQQQSGRYLNATFEALHPPSSPSELIGSPDIEHEETVNEPDYF